jgi:hypothetical protein
LIPTNELAFTPCLLRAVRLFIEQHHYSHSTNGVKVSQCFAVHHGIELVGAVLFGQMSTTAWKKFGETEADVLELRRLVLLDEVGRNAESKTIGWCLRWLKKNTNVKVIVSYADPNAGHSGTIYRAANFRYQGVSAPDKGFYDPENGKTYHSRALRTKYKGEYKPFVKRLREKQAKGLLEPVILQGKHCFTYRL